MKVNYIGIACMAVLLLTACDESKYELENLVPDEYHKVLYINNSGMQDLTLYNTGELNTYAFSVYKGGSDPSLTASVEIAIHSQEEVDALYGVNYRVIPSDFYSMDTRRLDFASDERSKAVTLSLFDGFDRCGNGGKSRSDLCTSALFDEREGFGQC